ncbi:MAG: hypothetical protein AB8V19_01345 [Candidatus Midichloria sp.]|uniref:Uncharacterized protein n=1 Tax=Hyalomma marginatum TaxID=34627 RepID=A0A8S4BW43_9ACAR|nr:hypothetical protein MHYMCMPSP_00183 [Hyalomma marginatum]CAG7592034.1 hypothetical protein MHYMCMPASI_00515 [Hyalomma marginatum]
MVITIPTMKDLEFVLNFKKPSTSGTIIKVDHRFPAIQFSSITPFSKNDKKTAKIAKLK